MKYLYKKINYVIGRIFFIKIVWLVSLVLGVTVSHLQAQKANFAAGDHVASDNYQLSYTIGEPIINTIIEVQNIITQGFHQSSVLITSISNPEAEEFYIKVYPIPTSDFLNVEAFGDKQRHIALIELFDNRGRKVKELIPQNEKTVIPMHAFIAATYTLRIVDSKKNHKSIKVIKQ